MENLNAFENGLAYTCFNSAGSPMHDGKSPTIILVLAYAGS